MAACTSVAKVASADDHAGVAARTASSTCQGESGRREQAVRAEGEGGRWTSQAGGQHGWQY